MKSSCAPVVTSLNVISSATLPPSKPHIESSNSFLVDVNVDAVINENTKLQTLFNETKSQIEYLELKKEKQKLQ